MIGKILDLQYCKDVFTRWLHGGRVLTVGPGNFKTIKEACNAAKPYDVIQVVAGHSEVGEYTGRPFIEFDMKKESEDAKE